MKQDDGGAVEDDREALRVALAALLAWQAFRVVGALAAFESALPPDKVATADELAGAALDLEAEMALFADTIRPYLGAEGGRAIAAMQMDYGIGLDVTTETDFVRELLQAQESRFARDMTETSVRAIRDQIAEGIANGEGHYQLRDRILTYYERNHAWRADIAAQYETGEAYEAVREALALQHGMTHKRWMTMRDDKVEAACLDNEAAGSISVDEAFPSGHMRPLAHPGCRCYCVWEP